ncbi:MAG: GntR family transcriptional regulator, arabinose operon transcriptional repressor [Epulopiscium sp.]|jgi:GntR family transcriptional regulator of arabinose operon|nr:araR2 [Defluviitaleaceae bacterium]MDK2788338.1 GntR family transcriptional regulator, arabinose operon transcriptional repressor [Candidatus Epulonipiscium sp.]
MSLNNEPKYIQLKEFIKNYISEGQLKADDKLFSEHELANRFQISRHTVRKAIGELINEGWLYQVQGKGTFVANTEGESKKKSKLIGVITTYLKDYIFPDIIYGIDEVLSKEGYTILLGHTNNEFEKERNCLLNMLNNNLDGLIIEPTKSVLPNPNIDIYERFKAEGIPIVFIHAYYNNFEASYVMEDDVLGGYMATRHLIEQGHQRIAGIFKSDDLQGLGRFQGFVQAHREHNLTINEKHILWFSSQDFDRLLLDDAYIQRFIHRLKTCTGLICYNDQIAINMLEILRTQGIHVPGDCAVVGFDNSELAQQGEIKLTTVAHPKEKLGRKAAASLLELINGTKECIQEKMEPELIMRDSTQTTN